MFSSFLYALIKAGWLYPKRNLNTSNKNCFFPIPFYRHLLQIGTG